MRGASYRRTAGGASALIAGLGFAACATAADAVKPADRFQLSGSASLQVASPPQTAAQFELHASLSEKSNAHLRAQEGGRFDLLASLSSSSLVCYNDTIFRDAFEGSGL